MNLPLRNPSPDFEGLEKVLRGDREPERVYFAELSVDEEIIRYIIEEKMNGRYIPSTEETNEKHQKQIADFYYYMGYDYVPTGPDWQNLPQFKERVAEDTAGLSRGQRKWVEEGGGIIKSWEDFEKIDWDIITHDLRRVEYVEKHLHKGMKCAVCAVLFEMILERFLGYEDLFILSVENPELVEAIFERWGQIVYDSYKEIVQHPKVGAFFHGDDLGHRSGTMLGPEFLRKNVFPWFKKYAALAHEEGKMYWYHCCGNVLDVMEDLIEDVGIDAFHSFQDVIIPVGGFVKKYGSRVAALGGVDVDNLGRMSELELRQYVRDILDSCMPGRYALGSGNSITNYVPPQNYFAMLDEGLRWSK